MQQLEVAEDKMLISGKVLVLVKRRHSKLFIL